MHNERERETETEKQQRNKLEANNEWKIFYNSLVSRIKMRF